MKAIRKVLSLSLVLITLISTGSVLSVGAANNGNGVDGQANSAEQKREVYTKKFRQLLDQYRAGKLTIWQYRSRLQNLRKALFIKGNSSAHDDYVYRKILFHLRHLLRSGKIDLDQYRHLVTTLRNSILR